MTVQIIDNILPQETNLRIIEALSDHHWFIAADKCTTKRLDKINSKTNAGFHIITIKDGKVECNSILNIYGLIIFDIIKYKLKIKNASLKRLFWNMYLPNAETEIHVDEDFSGYKSVLYSLHTTDGGIEVDKVFYPDIIGQAKIFDSHTLHKGFGPKKDNVRFNLNIVFKTE